MKVVKNGRMEAGPADSLEDWAKWWQGYGDTMQPVLMSFHIKNRRKSLWMCEAGLVLVMCFPPNQSQFNC